jgi:hypothetical protein
VVAKERVAGRNGVVEAATMYLVAKRLLEHLFKAFRLHHGIRVKDMLDFV